MSLPSILASAPIVTIIAIICITALWITAVQANAQQWSQYLVTVTLILAGLAGYHTQQTMKK